MRRHRRAVAVAAVAVLSLVVGLALAVWQARVATIQRERADRRFNDVRQLANALIFSLHDAVAPLPGSTPVRQQIVSEGLKYLERLRPESGGDPALQIELGRAYVQIGAVQGRPNAANLGDRTGAIDSFRKAQALLAPSATRADASPAVFGSYLDAIRFESEVLDGDAKLAAARRAAEEATRFVARHPNLDEAWGFQARAEFQVAMATRSLDALSHWQKAGAIYDALLAKQPDDPARQRNAALVEKYLGGVYETQTDYAAALPHHLRALALDQQRYSRSPGDRVAKLDVAIDLGNVAYAHWRQDAIEEAIAMYRQSLAMRQELLASDPKDAFARSKVAFVHRQLGVLADIQGSAVEATDHLRQAIRHYQQGDLSGVEQIDAAEAWAVLAKLEARGGRSAAACDAVGYAFRHNVTSDPRTRIVRNRDQKDPLIDIAPRAAACGIAGAAEWLKTHGPRTPSR